jgi:molybdopterin-binding protein
VRCDPAAAVQAVAHGVVVRAAIPQLRQGLAPLRRSPLKGKIDAVQKGKTRAHVRIDIGRAVVGLHPITNEAVDELKLKKGQAA